MHILHLIASLDPAQGGPPVVAERLARAQKTLGHTVQLAAPDAVDTSESRRISACGFTDIWRAPPADLLELLRPVDVLHLHGIWEPVILCAAKAAASVGLPYLVTPHGMLDPWSLQQKKWKKRVALALGYRGMLNRAAALHVLNADEQRLIEPLGLATQFEIIPNGIFLEEIDSRPDASLFRHRPNGPGDQPFVLFLSRLHYKKGLDYLADAFKSVAAKHPDLRLVVAGPDGGEETAFRQRIAELGLGDRVIIPGAIYGAEKWSALSGASVFCLPSRQEGFSMAILEAMACRVPVVVSENCHFPDVADVGAGIVTALDAQATAQALDQVLSHPAVATSMGLAGRKLVEDRFTWPQVAARSLDVYTRIARKGQLG